jgi:hypothetical protein
MQNRIKHVIKIILLSFFMLKSSYGLQETYNPQNPQDEYDRLILKQEASKPTLKAPAPGDVPIEKKRRQQQFRGYSRERTTIEEAPIPFPYKYALLIGNTKTFFEENVLAFAASDMDIMRDVLVRFAGYGEPNIVVLKDATISQINNAAFELSSRAMPGGSLFLYFSGIGLHVDGRDYLTGVDTENITDPTHMISKSLIYGYFAKVGVSIFAFYQTDRPIDRDKNYFGKELPFSGAIAETYGTLPGQQATGLVTEGGLKGIFTLAMVNTLTDLEPANMPILEFGWQTFSRLRRLGGGTSGGGSRQMMTLPQLLNLGKDATF